MRSESINADEVVTAPISIICLASGFEPGCDDLWFVCPM